MCERTTMYCGELGARTHASKIRFCSGGMGRADAGFDMPAMIAPHL
jgi:hypothetical protein